MNKTLGICLLFLSAVSTQICLAEGVPFTFKNESKWKIEHLYISAVKQQEWGADQLEKDVIDSKQTFIIKDIIPGKYDIKVVDEDGDICVVEDVEFKVAQSVTMTDEKLVACQAATKIENKESPNEE